MTIKENSAFILKDAIRDLRYASIKKKEKGKKLNL